MQDYDGNTVMDHLVRVGLKMCLVPEEYLDHVTTDFGPESEWAIKGNEIVGRVATPEEKEQAQKPLPFERRKDLFTAMPYDPDVITREAYYRRES